MVNYLETLDLESFLQFSIESIDGQIKSLIDKGDLKKQLSDDLHEIVGQRMFSKEWAEKYYQSFKIEGTKASDYKLQFLNCGQMGKVLAGIHFYGGDKARPFIGVLARTKAFETVETLEFWLKKLSEAFSKFNPESVQFFQYWESKEVPFSSIKSSIPDQHLISGYLKDLKSEQKKLDLKGLELIPLKEMRNFSTYSDSFKEFQESNQLLAKRVFPSSEEMLNLSAKNKTLFEINIEGSWAGILATISDREGPLKGQLIVEEYLDKKYRGKGFGKIAQSALIKRLPERSGPFLYGTIDAENMASVRTAYSNGRSKVGSWYFFPLN